MLILLFFKVLQSIFYRVSDFKCFFTTFAIEAFWKPEIGCGGSGSVSEPEIQIILKRLPIPGYTLLNQTKIIMVRSRDWTKDQNLPCCSSPRAMASQPYLAPRRKGFHWSPQWRHFPKEEWRLRSRTWAARGYRRCLCRGRAPFRLPPRPKSPSDSSQT